MECTSTSSIPGGSYRHGGTALLSAIFKLHCMITDQTFSTLYLTT
jgi:hypothetical protein